MAIVSKFKMPDGTTVDVKDTTYSNATTTTAGLMSAADKTRLNDLGATTGSNSYSGSIVGGGNSPQSVTIPAGKWLVTTSGYAWHDSANSVTVFGLGFNTGPIIKGLQPTWVLTLTQSTAVYIWNLHGDNITAVDLTINALRIG